MQDVRRQRLVDAGARPELREVPGHVAVVEPARDAGCHEHGRVVVNPAVQEPLDPLQGPQRAEDGATLAALAGDLELVLPGSNGWQFLIGNWIAAPRE